MRYNTIRQLDIANGPGCRVSLFVQGCSFHCPGCFNPGTQDFEGGKEFTDQTIEAILAIAKPNHISGLSLLGGEPLHPRNRATVLELAKRFKREYPDKNIWLWTGFLLEDVFEDLVDSEIDVLVDGRFVEDLKDLRLKYRGSSNQRVIDLKETIRTGDIILYEGNQ
jgi:anaerobic ribonucleoside-triphosphate reductase activating protein